MRPSMPVSITATPTPAPVAAGHDCGREDRARIRRRQPATYRSRSPCDAGPGVDADRLDAVVAIDGRAGTRGQARGDAADDRDGSRHLPSAARTSVAALGERDAALRAGRCASRRGRRACAGAAAPATASRMMPTSGARSRKRHLQRASASLRFGACAVGGAGAGASGSFGGVDDEDDRFRSERSGAAGSGTSVSGAAPVFPRLATGDVCPAAAYRSICAATGRGFLDLRVGI